jgi:hypothetical protein
MGVKSNYFRHSFTAHSDIKIRRLIKKVGAKGYAIYFVLLEVYCSKTRDDDAMNIEQEIDLKFVASLLGLRSDSVHSCLIVMGELGLIDQLSLKYDDTMVKLSISKSLKYYGSYKKVADEKIPNKRKEKERKEKEMKVESKHRPPESDNSDFQKYVAEHLTFLDQDELNCFKTGSKKALDYLLQRFELNDIQRYFNQVVEYNLNNPKKARKDFPMTLRNWMDKGKQENKLSYKESYIGGQINDVLKGAFCD